MTVPITPETRLADLLAAWPAAEGPLVEWVPALARLQNPALRGAVLRVTTLEQAAGLGSLPAAELVRRLRAAAGQGGTEPVTHADDRPDWVREDRVRARIDAVPMLERGEHPVGLVRASIAELGPGELICLLTPFRPAPLIDAMQRGGATAYTVEREPGRHETYFLRQPA